MNFLNISDNSTDENIEIAIKECQHKMAIFNELLEIKFSKIRLTSLLNQLLKISNNSDSRIMYFIYLIKYIIEKLNEKSSNYQNQRYFTLFQIIHQGNFNHWTFQFICNCENFVCLSLGNFCKSTTINSDMIGILIIEIKELILQYQECSIQKPSSKRISTSRTSISRNN